MKKLTEKQINAIVELLKEGRPLPEEYRWFLFEGKQETELVYGGKTRDVDVLTETMAVPLQKVKRVIKYGLELKREVRNEKR